MLINVNKKQRRQYTTQDKKTCSVLRGDLSLQNVMFFYNCLREYLCAYGSIFNAIDEARLTVSTSASLSFKGVLNHLPKVVQYTFVVGLF